jgi:transposase
VAFDKWTKLQMTPGKLRELHQKHTQPEMAVMLGVTEMTVRRWLRKHNIEGLHSYERRVQDRTGPTLADLKQETLRQLYEERLLTDGEIGDHYGVTKTPIRHRRREWGIETISKAERSARLRPQKVSTKAPPKPSSTPKSG